MNWAYIVGSLSPGLSLLGYPGLEDLDPVYCMPAEIIEKRDLRKNWRALDRRLR